MSTYYQCALFLVTLIVLLVVAMIVVTFIPALFIRRMHVSRLRELSRGKMVLTYDDGPGERLVPPLLELLARYDVRATFFLLGQNAEKAPSICDRIQDAGHEIGCHSQHHLRIWRNLPSTITSDMNSGYRTLSRWIDKDALFRPPYGKITLWTWLAIRKRGGHIALWTIYSGDVEGTSQYAHSVPPKLVRDGGGVVLLHCDDRGEEHADYVLKLTEQLLITAREHNLKTCTVSKLFDVS